MLECALLCLPREIRDVIYAYALPERLQLRSRHCKESLSFYESNGLLLANHQIRKEANEALERQLPIKHIIFAHDAHLPPLQSPDYFDIRRKIQNLVIALSCRKHEFPAFALLPQTGWHADVKLYQIRKEFPSLRQVTFEITWQPKDTYTVLLPRRKEEMVMGLRKLVGGGIIWDAWDLEYQIRDATRWKNAWSGVIVATKR